MQIHCKDSASEDGKAKQRMGRPSREEAFSVLSESPLFMGRSMYASFPLKYSMSFPILLTKPGNLRSGDGLAQVIEG